ncbi:MAG: DNA-binding domain-containing protein [Gammaproteobacteria bacterium]|nr:DNA-binding domain-containing protein [Gammaproteobacteria bacterium]
MQLAEFQRQFFEVLDNPENTEHPFYSLCPSSLELSQAGFTVYKHSMQASLCNALGKNFPACKRLVGEEFFTHLCYAYIACQPSHSPNLIHYGHNFPGFCETLEALTSLPYFSDLAKLELIWQQVFYGPTNPLIDWHHLQTAIQNQGVNIIFNLPANCRLIKSEYAVDKIWQTCQPEYRGQLNFSIDQPTYLAVFQLEHSIKLVNLSLAEWTFLGYLSKQTTLEKICEGFQALALPSQPAEFLSRLCQLQLIRLTP